MPTLSEILKAKRAAESVASATNNPMDFLDKIEKIMSHVGKLQNSKFLSAPAPKNETGGLNPADIVSSPNPSQHTIQPTIPVNNVKTEFQVIKTLDEEKIRKSLVKLMSNIKDEPIVKLASMSQFIDKLLSDEGTQKQFAQSIKKLYDEEEAKV